MACDVRAPLRVDPRLDRELLRPETVLERNGDVTAVEETALLRRVGGDQRCFRGVERPRGPLRRVARSRGGFLFREQPTRDADVRAVLEPVLVLCRRFVLEVDEPP